MPHELDLHSLAEELARPDGAPPLDTAILAATAALSSAPESAGGQSAVAEALRCVVRIANSHHSFSLHGSYWEKRESGRPL